MKKKRSLLIVALAVTFVSLCAVENLVRRGFGTSNLPERMRLEVEKGWDTAIFRRAKHKAKEEIKKRRQVKKVPASTACLSASYFQDAPVIDGRLNEPCWQSAFSIYPFVDSEGDRLAKNQSRGYVGYSQDTLYIGIKCEESFTRSIKADVDAHDGRVWTDDCVEVLIDPENKGHNFFRLIVNARGTMYEARISRAGGKMNIDTEWNPPWSAATFIGDSFWSAEMSIPLKRVWLTKTKNIEIGMNLCRQRYSNYRESSSWSCTFGNVFNPERFGKVLFGEGLPLEIFPIRSRLGNNELKMRVKGGHKSALSGELRLLLPRGQLLSKTEEIKAEGDNLSFSYKLKETGRRRLIFSLVSSDTGIVYYKSDNIPAGIGADMFVRDWLVCGPFPTAGRNSLDVNFLKFQGVEEAIEPEEGSSLRWAGRKYAWRPIRHREESLNFAEILSGWERTLAYAACRIYSSKERDALVRTGCSDPYKLWINHTEAKPGQTEYKTHLQRGDNLLLIKVDHSSGESLLYLRLTDLSGYPL